MGVAHTPRSKAAGSLGQAVGFLAWVCPGLRMIRVSARAPVCDRIPARAHGRVGEPGGAECRMQEEQLPHGSPASPQEQKFCQRYDQLMEAWEKKVERIENNPRRRAKESKVREYYEKQFPEIRKQRELQERMQR